MAITSKFGLEIECGVPEYKSIDRGEYHSGYQIGRYWDSERDGTVGQFPIEYKSYEFVSTAFGKKNLKKVLDELKKILQIQNEQQNSDKHILFNKTCGSHIHFSIIKDKKTHHLYQAIPLQKIREFRKDVFNQMKKRFTKDQFNEFRKQYFRKYAKNMQGNYSSYSNKYKEINFTSGKGMEWRSFNLIHVKTWKDLEDSFQIAFDCLDKHFTHAFQKNKFVYEEKINFEKPKKQVFKIRATTLDHFIERLDQSHVQLMNQFQLKKENKKTVKLTGKI